MPQLFNLNFLDRFPIPTLKNYTLFSSLLFLLVLYHAYFQVTKEENWSQLQVQLAESSLGNRTKELVNDFTGLKMLYFALSDHNCIWVIVNTASCLVAVWGNIIKWFVFGKLRPLEQQYLRDRFWNFVFYKFVFLFGVLNVQFVDEVFLWSVWFIIVGFFFILTSLAQDRFKYVSSAVAGTRSSLWRVVFLMGVSCLSTLIMLIFSVTISPKIGLNYTGFLIADASQMMLRSTYCLCRYGAQLYDLRQENVWERRHSFVYYSELVFELLILVTDFVHHVHMLVWSNIFLSMASLVICMQLRSLYQEIDRRLKRHRNYQRVVEHMDQHFPLASSEELSATDDTCAICWDPMETARKLPCGHFFHNWCLRGWLEQDTTCPTCRMALQLSSNPVGDADAEAIAGQQGLLQRRRRRFNHFFHFDGGRYARWLPSFSVEVSHNLGGPGLFRRTALSNSQYNNMAEQVREMFPHIPLAAILDDLHETASADITVENILEGRLSTNEQLAADVGSDDGSDVYESDTGDEDDAEEDSGDTYEEDDYGNVAGGSSQVLEVSSPLELRAETAGSKNFVSGPSWSNSSVPSVPETGSRFSKSSEEREHMLNERKQQLIQRNRKRYLDSEKGKRYSTETEASGSSSRRQLPTAVTHRKLRHQNIH